MKVVPPPIQRLTLGADSQEREANIKDTPARCSWRGYLVSGGLSAAGHIVPNGPRAY